MNEPRVRHLITQALATFDLELSGLIVLTEAATGYYILTPLIAALAGADKVLALTRDSRFGRAVDVQETTLALARRWGIEEHIDILLAREDARIGQADIVTNQGFVRPIDASFLRRLKPTVSIPLMWETWEYRSEDLDLAECRRLDIPVLGTNEHHPELRLFEYIGHLALKLLFTLDIEIYRSFVVIIGSGEFAEQTLTTLRAAGAEVAQLSPQVEGALQTATARQMLQRADAVVVVEHHSRRMLIGSPGDITADELCALNSHLVVAHICGGVQQSALEAVGLRCAPDRFALPGYMSVATDFLGPKPLIDLHTAGLKVGERLARTRAKGLSAWQAECTVLQETDLAQGFSEYHPVSENCRCSRRNVSSVRIPSRSL
jgi:hypothetical protein